MGKRFQQSSGRIVSIGRLLLATLFLIAFLADPGAAPAPPALLWTYVVFAAVVAFATWNNWWLDAKAAGLTHAFDILLFTALAVQTGGHTSPLFALFVFLLLAAAIRWSWRATALTAILLTLLYLWAGLLVRGSQSPLGFDQFVVGTGHLLILSLILIWFGANRWRGRFAQLEELSTDLALPGASPIEKGLRAAMQGSGAGWGLFLWREGQAASFQGLLIAGRDGGRPVEAPAEAIEEAAPFSPFLFDYEQDRGLRRDIDRNLPDIKPRKLIDPGWAQEVGLDEGLAIPLRAGQGQGLMILQRIKGLAVDHIDLGEQIAGALALHIQRHALLRSAEEQAEARARLSLARDLHDGLVQFVAGAAFRLEAMKRAQANGRSVAGDLDELKHLMLDEQRELRTFLTALRSGPDVAFDQLAAELSELSGRLSRHWDLDCRLTARPADRRVPTRVHLSCLQMVREAVANAARHACASNVRIELQAEDRLLHLLFANDGEAYPTTGGRFDPPGSLRERAEEVGGSIEVVSGEGLTRIFVRLPIVRESQ